MSHGRAVLGALVALVLLAGCAASPAGGTTTEDPDEISRRHCAEKTQEVAGFAPATPVATGPRGVAVVVGDSYALGTTSPDPREDGWVTVFARATGRTAYSLGFGGTGFTAEGDCPPGRFASRLDAALALRPALLVFEGGINDVDDDVGEVSRAAQELVTTARARGVPAVALVGPAPAPSRPQSVAVESALREAAAIGGVPYVSLENAGVAFGDDRLHPTVEGYAAMGRRVAEALP